MSSEKSLSLSSESLTLECRAHLSEDAAKPHLPIILQILVQTIDTTHHPIKFLIFFKSHLPILTQVATYTIFRALQPVFIQIVHFSAVFCGVACSAAPEEAQSNRLCYKWQLALF